MATVIGVQDMRHDLADYLPEMSVREKVGTWLRFYCKLTSWAVDPLVSRWQLHLYGPVPPMATDNIARHFGWVEGVPHCPIGEVCEHGWVLTEKAAEGGGIV